MKKIALLLTALLIVPAILPAQPKKDRPDTDIEKAMHRIGKAYRQLRKQAADPAQNDSSLELAAAIRAGALEAQKQVPLKAADVAESERSAFIDDYRMKMGEFIDTVDQLEGSLKAGNNDEAVRLTRELEDLQKKDHKEFRRPEKPGRHP